MPAPAANFALSHAGTFPTVGQTITFLDQSSPTPTSWAWDFGDGTSGSSGPSGEPMPNYDLNGWRLAQAHDFNTNYPVGSFGPTRDDVPAEFAGLLRVYEDGWRDTASSGGGDPSLPSRYMPSQVLSCNGGMMVWRLFNSGSGARSAAVQVGGDTLYGRYSMRLRADAVDGFKTAVLTWPQSGIWPRDGEIDFPEGALQGGIIDAFMHRQNATSGSDQDYRSSGENYQSWHTCVIEWAPNSCKFIIDGRQLGATITSRVPNTPMHYVMQIESHLGGNQPPVGTNGYLYCDWVVRWTYDPTATDGSSGATGSTLQNPTHTYTEPGVYNITLTATNADGSDSITIPWEVKSEVWGTFNIAGFGEGLYFEPLTAALAGTVETGGVLTATLEPLTASLAGDATPITDVVGVLSVSLVDATAVFDGASTVAGDLTATLGTLTAGPSVAYILRISTISARVPYSIMHTPDTGLFSRWRSRFARGNVAQFAILKEAGVYRNVYGPVSPSRIIAAEVYYGGGRDHVITLAEVEALTAAGYGSMIDTSVTT